MSHSVLASLAVAFAATLVAGTALASEPDAPAEAPLTFVFGNPRLGMEGGVRTFDSLGRLVVYTTSAVPAGVFQDETTPHGKALGVFGRIGKLVLFDEPVAEFEGTAIHEVFGHGSRAREFHMSASYTFTLPGVYCFLFSPECGSRGHTQRAAFAKTVDNEIAIVAGGVEANYLTAHWVNARIAETAGRVRYDDALLYSLSKMQYAGSFFGLKSASTATSGSNDIENYALLLADRQNRLRSTDRDRIAMRLTLASLWNLADPMLWASIYGLLVRYVAVGERTWQLPLPRVLGATVFAVPRFNLAPFGAEHYVDVFMHHSRMTANVYARVGSSGNGSYAGAGARVFRFKLGERVYGGTELDVWKQPELLFEERAVYNRRELWGWNVATTAEWRFHERVGMFGRFGYKTRGHLMGQPLAEGVHGYFGLTLSLERGAAAARDASDMRNR
ncbi:MAG: hypothetical protein U0174_06985 [Polyangiaceae bacterium]